MIIKVTTFRILELRIKLAQVAALQAVLSDVLNFAKLSQVQAQLD